MTLTIHGTIPAHGFEIIYADPAWKFASNSAAKPGRNALRHYPCMKTAEIADMPVREIAAKDALLFLWATVPMLPDALAVMEAWGFTYKSGFVWLKERVGTGYWVRNEHELVLLGKRGKFPCGRKAPFPRSAIRGGQGEHSAKPPYLQDRIEEVWPDRSKLELFSRQWRLGWSVHGNEVPHADHALRDGARGTGHNSGSGGTRGLCDGVAPAAEGLHPEACDAGGMGGDRPAQGADGTEAVICHAQQGDA